jgi:hypothetical protein
LWITAVAFDLRSNVELGPLSITAPRAIDRAHRAPSANQRRALKGMVEDLRRDREHGGRRALWSVKFRKPN